MADKLSSLDIGYVTGDLSIFPEAIDTRETLYEAKNNAETVLTQTLNYNGKNIVVENTTNFPSQGLIKINSELIYYAKKTETLFTDLKRKFAYSKQMQHPVGSKVMGSVMAEHHNAIKDAILNIESNIGTKIDPADGSLNAILKLLETKYLSPKPKFRAYPLKGSPPLKVRFQNFSSGSTIRYLWDFGDGTTSLDNNPIHTYIQEGVYTVKLSVITSLGSQGFVTKNEYIDVNASNSLSLFYAEQNVGTAGVTDFVFIDQTKGDVVERYWVWDDGTTTAIKDGDIHTASHIYEEPGEYEPSLLVVLSDGTLKRMTLEEKITVT